MSDPPPALAAALAPPPEGVVPSLIATPRAGTTAIDRLDGDALR